jgi:hypothetical protein
MSHNLWSRALPSASARASAKQEFPSQNGLIEVDDLQWLPTARLADWILGVRVHESSVLRAIDDRASTRDGKIAP